MADTAGRRIGLTGPVWLCVAQPQAFAKYASIPESTTAREGLDGMALQDSQEVFIAGFATSTMR